MSPFGRLHQVLDVILAEPFLFPSYEFVYPDFLNYNIIINNVGGSFILFFPQGYPGGGTIQIASGTKIKLVCNNGIWSPYTILNVKFITLKKELRVDLAKKELINGKLVSHSMEGIWTKCGFSYKTNFFVAFKEVTGMTPLEFSKEINKNRTTD
jgi:hypothetical protein